MPNLSNPWIAALLSGTAGASKGLAQERKTREEGARRMREMGQKSALGRIDASYESMLRDKNSASAQARLEGSSKYQAEVEHRKAQTADTINKTSDATKKLQQTVIDKENELKQVKEAQKVEKDRIKAEAALKTKRNTAVAQWRGLIQSYDAGEIEGKDLQKFLNSGVGNVLDQTPYWNKNKLEDIAQGKYPKRKSPQEREAERMGQQGAGANSQNLFQFGAQNMQPGAEIGGIGGDVPPPQGAGMGVDPALPPSGAAPITPTEFPQEMTPAMPGAAGPPPTMGSETIPDQEHADVGDGKIEGILGAPPSMESETMPMGPPTPPTPTAPTESEFAPQGPPTPEGMGVTPTPGEGMGVEQEIFEEFGPDTPDLPAGPKATLEKAVSLIETWEKATADTPEEKAKYMKLMFDNLLSALTPSQYHDDPQKMAMAQRVQNALKAKYGHYL